MTSRRDYEAVAALLRQERRMAESEYLCSECGSPEDQVLDRLTEGLADLFAQGNPRFDRARFMAAAGDR